MNTFRFLLTTLVLSSVLLSSCKDDDDEVLSEVHYHIKTTNRSSTMFNWTSGTANGRQIEFKGTTSGNRVEEYVLTPNQVNLFGTSSFIKEVKLKPGTYTNVEMNYEMTPTRSPSLQLKGTYNNGTTTTPITLNLEQYLEISTKLAIIEIASGRNYIATINLDLNSLMTVFTAAQLNNAQRTNGEIIIAYYSNPVLYAAIIDHINNKMTHQVEFTQM